MSLRIFLGVLIISIGLISPSVCDVLAQIQNNISFDKAIEDICHYELMDHALLTFINLPIFGLLAIIVCLCRKPETALIYMTCGLMGILFLMSQTLLPFLQEFYSGKNLGSTAALAFLVFPFFIAFGLAIGLFVAFLICYAKKRLWSKSSEKHCDMD